MKTRIALSFAAAALFATQLFASQLPPSVPDSGGTAGILAIGLLAVLALRRKLAK
jgi:hypothetical protein